MESGLLEEKSDKYIISYFKKKKNHLALLTVNYYYFFLCEGGRFNGYMISITGYIIMIEWFNTGVELMASP